MNVFTSNYLTYFLIGYFICIFNLNAEMQPRQLTFFDLHENTGLKNGEFVQIRGFLYKTDRGESLLAAEPDLKSCCVGTTLKRDKQLLIIGEIESKNYSKIPVTLQGDLIVDLERPFRYHLEKVAVVEENKQWNILWVIIALVLCAGGGAIALGLKRKL
jgi:hypothetical protein